MLSNRALLLSAVVALLISLGLFSLACTDSTGTDAASTEASNASNAAETEAVTVDAFGIEATGYRVKEQTIRRNQTFSDLVQPHGISPQLIHRIANDEALREVFDVRRIRAGRTMHVYRDSTDTAQLLVYEQDQINYVTLDLRDGIAATSGARDVETRQRTVHGVIESSPYRALQRAGASPHLAVQLANVLAWQVDFYRIQRGDQFTIVYEQDYIDDEPVRLGRILATRFEHAGRAHTALYYAHSEGTDYFNEAGESMRKAFLRAPL
ncbi:MAG: peptidase M23, partial [Bacteroidetes bacterium]|nr:peptidase M23 [Bacteroidota bacterium]